MEGQSCPEASPDAGTEVERLTGKEMALIFEKTGSP